MLETVLLGWALGCKRGRAVRLLSVLALTYGATSAHAQKEEPCCSITAIHAKARVVAAREAKTGRKFQFKVGELVLLKSLKVGQRIHADFATQKVSVDGVALCCGIVQSARSAGANRAKEKVAQEPPCCSLTAIDRTTGVVSARNRTSGQVVSFKVSHAKFLAGLRVGQRVDLANIGGDRLVVRTDAAEVEAIRIN